MLPDKGVIRIHTQLPGAEAVRCHSLARIGVHVQDLRDQVCGPFRGDTLPFGSQSISILDIRGVDETGKRDRRANPFGHHLTQIVERKSIPALLEQFASVRPNRGGHPNVGAPCFVEQSAKQSAEKPELWPITQRIALNIQDYIQPISAYKTTKVGPGTVAKVFKSKVRVIEGNHASADIYEKANGARPVLTLTPRDPLFVKTYGPGYGAVNALNLDMVIRRGFKLFYLDWIGILLPFKRIQT